MRCIPVSAYQRIRAVRIEHIAAHMRHIGDASPEAPALRVERDDITLDMFQSDEQTIIALASRSDGAEITGRLLEAARQQWR